MEATGVALDREALAVLDAEFATEITRLEQEIHGRSATSSISGSPKQLEQVLFYELNLPKGRRTKTGYSTDANVLEELRPAHPMIGKLLDWRTYTKLRSTYIEALPTLLASDGRLHTTFHQAVAVDGPPVVVRPEPPEHPDPQRARPADPARLRRRRPGTTLLAADYSQIELRILAHVTGDEHLRDAFARQSDIHRETAARVLHKAPGDVNADERSMAKMVNFGLAYGMSDFGLSTRAGISRQEAQTFINEYFAAYPGISYYMIHIKDTARSAGRGEDPPRAPSGDPGARGTQPEPARGRRADGHQHAHPGHRGRHHEDRDDPRRRGARARGLRGPDAAAGPRRARLRRAAR